MAAGLLLLLCVGSVLSLVRAQDAYARLPESYRNGVNLTLEQLNSHTGVHHHFRFLKSLEKSEIESGFGVSYLYHHFYLKPTWCAKGTEESNPEACAFRNDRPLMDCAICYKTANNVMEANPKPYVHCIQKPRLTPDMRRSRTEHCRKMSYNSGAPTLLAVKVG
ncbi:uncharacterized protein [Takifugu rubripes]|uniref:Retinoic acid receptor responder protein 2 n=1 Tax=Takifugu rubripes TaxID=31033 RepID=A0A3B5KI53_TAKRU|nr:uncharacterized protein LOC101062321 [Takifugu rubripes]|eukprot:XP_003968134.1 PREDICTED: uncharacterized protein LOC101062321 [Takifugu rubripes]